MSGYFPSSFSFCYWPPPCPATQLKSVFYCAIIGKKVFHNEKRPKKSMRLKGKAQRVSLLPDAGLNALMPVILIWKTSLVPVDRQNWMTEICKQNWTLSHHRALANWQQNLVFRT